ncbi:MAG: TetR/AcrR family transcriptional regulator [Halieaceae bacterium]|jgi:AcrR family transcriptional regulator|nr:TetR/AcrR family transcriptional regulator [Halieaceae bacterium]
MNKTDKPASVKSRPGSGQAGAAKKPDGRLLRTERSRQQIIDALQALVNEGVLVPTAQTVAERAGVGIRTVFRHFADMETLFATMDTQLRESYEGLFAGGDRAGTLEERILHVIERRATAYEKLSSLMLSTRAQMWRSPVLQKNYARNQRGLRKDLADWLPEIADLPVVRREAIDAVTSFETWSRLRLHQGLSVKSSMDVVHETLRLYFDIG